MPPALAKRPIAIANHQDTKDLIRKVRLIELKTRGLSNHIFSGEYHSAFKGRGMAFSEVREYVPGDEVRAIDWNVTARLGHPYIKIFDEERELTVMLVADVSGSGQFGTAEMLKRELITEVCATIAFSAIQNNDKVGLILFSDQVELFIPPKKGRGHILRIVRELLEFTPQSRGTDIAGALKYLNNVIKKRSIAFLISDLMDEGFEDALKIANRKHDLVVLRTTDPREEEMPDIGLVQFMDPETGRSMWVNTGNKAVRDHYRAQALKHQARSRDSLRRAGVDHAVISTRDGYVRPLMNLFRQRD
ncbi:MAG: DUF58 domain-containing protein [Flavobacteriales bacterium]|nr:DUF58 domain-containing protein [Flavobacteriales bacterium]MEB2343048.1 DUF58 domain-containing protein [Flavobacteriia bacterium]